MGEHGRLHRMMGYGKGVAVLVKPPVWEFEGLALILECPLCKAPWTEDRYAEPENPTCRVPDVLEDGCDVAIFCGGCNRNFGLWLKDGVYKLAEAVS